jgi:hypothetical protein
MEDRSHARQMLGSLLVAAAIVAIAIAVVTAKLGPTSVAEQEARENRLETRLDLREERLKQRQDRLEERAKGD